MKRLVDYTRFHFTREEAIMSESEYPDLKKHKATHAVMVQRTEDLSEQVRHDVESTADDVMEFLKNWWIDHILIKDSLYKPYLSENTLKSQTSGEV
jgi:hemerythrin